MTNSGHFWVPDEEQAALELDWPEFSAKYDDISFHAWRQRKARLLREEASSVETTPEPFARPSPIIVPGDVAYEGFSMAFTDMETTFSTRRRVLYAALADGAGRLERFSRNDYPGKNRLLDDSELVNAYARALERYDIIVTYNGKGFDIPTLQGRLAKHGLMPLRAHWHIDLFNYTGKYQMQIGRRSLDAVSKFFGVQDETAYKTEISVETWDAACAGDEEAYAEIALHCDMDCEVTRRVFPFLKRHIARLERMPL